MAIARKEIIKIAELVVDMETLYFKDADALKGYVKRYLWLFCSNSNSEFDNTRYSNYISNRINTINKFKKDANTVLHKVI